MHGVTCVFIPSGHSHLARQNLSVYDQTNYSMSSYKGCVEYMGVITPQKALSVDFII